MKHNRNTAAAVRMQLFGVEFFIGVSITIARASAAGSDAGVTITRTARLRREVCSFFLARESLTGTRNLAVTMLLFSAVVRAP